MQMEFVDLIVNWCSVMESVDQLEALFDIFVALQALFNTWNQSREVLGIEKLSDNSF